MKLKYSIPRIPFAQDRLFGIVFLIFLTIPLVFSFFLYEKYESVKLSLWLVLAGAGLFFLQQRSEQPNRENILKKPKIYLLLVILPVLGLFSTLFGENIYNSVLGNYPRFGNGFIVFVLACLTGFFVWKKGSGAKLAVFSKVIFFDLLIIAIFGILQSLGVAFYSGPDQSFFVRAPSFLGNPNFSSMFLASGVFLGLPLLLKASSFPRKVYYGVSMLFILLATGLFSSRGAWLGIVLGVAVGFALFLLSKKSIRYFLAVSGLFIILGILSLGVMNQVRPGFLTPTLTLSETNVNLRFYVWDIAREAVLKKPFLGFGPGNFQLVFQELRGSNLSDQNGVYDDTHNFYLQTAVSYGLFFTAGLLFLLFAAIARSGKNFLKNGDFFHWAAVCGIVSWCVSAAFNPVVIPCFLLLVFLLVLAFYENPDLVTASAPENSEAISAEPALVLKKSFIGKIFCYICGACFVLLGFSLLFSEIFFARGYGMFYRGSFEQSRKNLNLALSFNPFHQLGRVYNTAAMPKVEDGDFEEKVRKITASQPLDSRTYVMVSKLYFMRYEARGEKKYLNYAINFLKIGKDLDPFLAQRYGFLGFFLTESGRLGLGREYVKAALILDSKSLPAWLLLAQVYQLEGNKPAMEAALQAALKLRPDMKDLSLLVKQASDKENKQIIPIPAAINLFPLE